MIVIAYKDNKITNIYSVKNKEDISLLNLKDKHKTFTTTSAYIGLDIRAVKNDGGILPLSEQVELGYRELTETEIIDNETIRQLTDLEMRKKFPERYPATLEENELTDLPQTTESNKE